MSKVITENTLMEITRSQKQKANLLQKLEPEKHQIIFQSEVTSPPKLKADLMSVLNQELQQANLPTYIKFGKTGYF